MAGKEQEINVIALPLGFRQILTRHYASHLSKKSRNIFRVDVIIYSTRQCWWSMSLRCTTEQCQTSTIMLKLTVQLHILKHLIQ